MKEEQVLDTHNQINNIIHLLVDIDDRLKSIQLKHYNIGEPKNKGTLYKQRTGFNRNELKNLERNLNIIEHILELWKTTN